MSLVKQLWIGIFVILILALGGSFFISTITAKHYLEQQLQLKNIDNATSLALSISQMEKDQVTIELLIAAQFDSGHYESIRLLDPNGKIIIEKSFNPNHNYHIPAWFNNLLSLEVKPGVAQIQDGWQQYGSLEIRSHSRYAKKELWRSTMKLLQWFLIASLFCGMAGTMILKLITKPLDIVVAQAEAIGQRRFITSKEPKTWEFKRLVQSMNTLSDSVKLMLEKKTQQLETFRKEAQQDPLTKLFNREHFLNLLDSTLTREDSIKHVSLCIVRLLNLAIINQKIGHQATDALLVEIADTLKETAALHNGNYTGRLNGTDFVIVNFNGEPIASLAQKLEKTLRLKLTLLAEDTEIALPVAGCYYQAAETRGQLLSRLDGALALAEQKGNHAVITLEENVAPTLQRNLNDWRQTLTTALAAHHLELAHFPVRLTNGDLLHWEKPIRLYIDGNWQPAGYFIGWAIRLGLLPDIDIKVVEHALKNILETEEPIAINISESSICDVNFRKEVKALLKEYSSQAKQLWIEFPESCAVRNLALFREFCLDIRDFGCQLGLEHVGLEFTQIRELQDIGLHYLKIDSAIVRNIDTKVTNHQFLQGLCAIGHSLGITMIAEGVMTNGEQQALEKLQIDAITGPGVL